MDGLTCTWWVISEHWVYIPNKYRYGHHNYLGKEHPYIIGDMYIPKHYYEQLLRHIIAKKWALKHKCEKIKLRKPELAIIQISRQYQLIPSHIAFGVFVNMESCKLKTLIYYNFTVINQYLRHALLKKM